MGTFMYCTYVCVVLLRPSEIPVSSLASKEQAVRSRACPYTNQSKNYCAWKLCAALQSGKKLAVDFCK
jgi:hypothetical protein